MPKKLIYHRKGYILSNIGFLEREMTLREYYRSLSEDQRKQYAEHAGTSKKYCDSHLMRPVPSRIPKRGLMRGLADASSGAVSLSEVVDHFYHINKAA